MADYQVEVEGYNQSHDDCDHHYHQTLTKTIVELELLARMVKLEMAPKMVRQMVEEMSVPLPRQLQHCAQQPLEEDHLAQRQSLISDALNCKEASTATLGFSWFNTTPLINSSYFGSAYFIFPYLDIPFIFVSGHTRLYATGPHTYSIVLLYI